MRSRGIAVVQWLFLFGLLLVCIRHDGERFHVAQALQNQQERDDKYDETIHVALVACHNRTEEALTSIRSILLTTLFPQRLFFHIVHDEANESVLARVLSRWGKNQKNLKEHGDSAPSSVAAFEFALYAAQLPEAFQNLFAPCACQRLFLHALLPPTVARVIYLDSDTLLLDDIARLWNEFRYFDLTAVAGGSSPSSSNKTQRTILAGMGAEREPGARVGYYKDSAQHPYYNQHGVQGLNSGVILLHLDRLRRRDETDENDSSFWWSEQIEALRVEYHDQLRYHDQDLLNIYFGQHPDRLHLLPSCRWNYRPDYCFYRSLCDTDDTNANESQKEPHNDLMKQQPLSLLHGNRGVFHESPGHEWSVKAFSLTYEAFQVTARQLEPLEKDVAMTATMHSLGTCAEVLQDLDQSVGTWTKTVTAEDMTNNCQAVALPKIMVTLYRACQRIQQSLSESGASATYNEEL